MVVLVSCVEEFTSVQALIFYSINKTQTWPATDHVQRNKPIHILGSNNLIQTYETPTVNWIQDLSTRHKGQWLNNTWSFGNSYGEAP